MKYRIKGSGAEFTGIVTHTNSVLALEQASYSLQQPLGNKDVVLEVDLPPLYKRTSVGKWQTLTFYLVLTEKGPLKRRVIQTDGAKDREYNTVVKRVQTKVYSQALEDSIQSTWNKKHNRDGWVLSQDDVVLQEPMLLHHWSDHKDKMVYPAIIQPKLNGVRATYKPRFGLISRKRNPLSINHLERQLNILGFSTDGELWHPKKSLEEIVSLIAHDPKGELQYHIFDRPNGGPSYIERMAVFLHEYKNVSRDMPNIKVIPFATVQDEDDVYAAFNVIKKMPHVDGAVVRTMDYDYKFDTRSYKILKVKELISDEYIVLDIDCDRDVLGNLIRFRFDNPAENGGPFNYIPNWTKERRAEAYDNALSGKEVFVGATYTLTFREYTSKGVPKHITGCVRRDYE